MKKLILILILLSSVQLQAQWTYSTSTDQMTGEITHYATTISINTIYFSFPYNGGSIFILQVQNQGRWNGVSLSASKAQFLIAGVGNTFADIKFDSLKIFSVYLYPSSDGSLNSVGLSNVRRIIKKLKNARLLMIEASFYQDGYKVIKFNVSNFKWNY